MAGLKSKRAGIATQALVLAVTAALFASSSTATAAPSAVPLEWRLAAAFEFRDGVIEHHQLFAGCEQQFPVWGFRQVIVRDDANDKVILQRTHAPPAWHVPAVDVTRTLPALPFPSPPFASPRTADAEPQWCYWPNARTATLEPARQYTRVWRDAQGTARDEVLIIESVPSDASSHPRVLLSTSIARNADVHGTVLGMAPPIGLPYVSPLSSGPVVLAYATLHPVGLPNVVADAAGEFTISGATTVSVVAELSSPYFFVCNEAGANAQIIDILDCVAPETLLFNASPTEFGSAQTAAFHMLGLGYSLLNSLSPGFAPAQVPVAASVNFAGGCAASYFPAFGLIFTRAGNGCPNAAYGSLVAHEYFHHIAFQLGGFTEPYDEAMADVFAAFVLGDPVIGPNFYGPLAHMRHLVGSAQYPDPQPMNPALEGLPLAQAFWDLRLALQASEGPITGAQLATELWFGSTLVSSGIVEPAIVLDLLELDDDDGDLSNGTPHSTAIVAAFAAHGFAPPIAPVTALTCTTAETLLTLDWQLPVSVLYDSVQISRDGLPIATLPGDSTLHTILFPQQGDHFYSVVGSSAGGVSMATTCQVHTPTFQTFLRGDMNVDGELNLIDVITILQHLLQSVPAPGCEDSGDVDDSGSVNIADPIYLLNYLFGQLAPPPPPFPNAGLDPTPDAMLCL